MSSLLFFNLLVLPLIMPTPVHRLQVMHFGHGIHLNEYDSSFDHAMQDLYLAKGQANNYNGGLDGKITIIELQVHAYRTGCIMPLQWAAVPNGFDAKDGYTVFIDPSAIASGMLSQIAHDAFLAVFEQEEFWVGAQIHFESDCPTEGNLQ